MKQRYLSKYVLKKKKTFSLLNSDDNGTEKNEVRKRLYLKVFTILLKMLLMMLLILMINLSKIK